MTQFAPQDKRTDSSDFEVSGEWCGCTQNQRVLVKTGQFSLKFMGNFWWEVSGNLLWNISYYGMFLYGNIYGIGKTLLEEKEEKGE